MNCNNCELKCSNQQNYCKLYGDDLKKYNTNTIKFYKNDFCEICGEKQNKGNRYCSKCGNNLSFIDKDKEIKWNFTKFLVDREGNVIKRFSPQTTPKSIEKDIEELLA